MPRLHAREAIVSAARIELATFISEWSQKHDLTVAEELQVLSGEAHSWIANVLKYEIREERHPDNPDKPGGLE